MVNAQHVGQKVFQANSYSVSEVVLVQLHEGDWSRFATVEHPAVRGTLLRSEKVLERVETLHPTSAEAYAVVKEGLEAYRKKTER